MLEELFALVDGAVLVELNVHAHYQNKYFASWTVRNNGKKDMWHRHFETLDDMYLMIKGSLKKVDKPKIEGADLI